MKRVIEIASSDMGFNRKTTTDVSAYLGNLKEKMLELILS
jgi:hypothetical protein